MAGIKGMRKAHTEEERQQKKQALTRRSYVKTREKRLAYGTQYRASHKAQTRNLQLQYLYGITLEQFDAMIVAQGKVCALCGGSFGDGYESPALDHNHITNKNRAVLHRKCNSGLGHFDDDPIRLKQAVEYLEKHNEYKF